MIIPPGREGLYRREAELTAELERLDKAIDRADSDDPKLGQLLTDHARTVAVLDRVHQERMAGLSFWIDTRADLPICTTCAGAGNRAGTDGRDVSDACQTCRGWGREDDGRPVPPVWSKIAKHWINPSTGRPADPPAPDADPPPIPPKEGAAVNEAVAGAVQGVSQVTPTGLAAAAASAATGKDIKTPAQMSLNELTEATRKAAYRLERRQQSGTPEEVKQAEDDNRRLSDAHRERAIESLDKQVEAAKGKAEQATEPGERDRWRSTAEMKQRSADQTRAERPAAAAATSAAGGTGMASIEEVRADILMACEKVNEGLASQQQAHALLEEAEGIFQRATEGSGQADVDEAKNLVSQAKTLQIESQQSALGGVQSAESVANRL